MHNPLFSVLPFNNEGTETNAMQNETNYSATLIKGKVPFQVSFVHPLKNVGHDLNKRRVCRSTGMTDWREAEKVKAALDSILSDPRRWNNLGEFSQVVRELWSLEKVSKDVGGYLAKTEKREAVSQNQVDILNETIRLQRIKIAELNALVKKLGGDAVAEFEPKPIDAAITDFIAKHAAKDRKRVQYQKWLERFAESLPKGQDCNLITADAVIAHLIDVKNGKFNNGEKLLPMSVKKIEIEICAFLRKATKDRFKKFEVKEWSKEHLKAKSNLRKKDLWLDETAWEALVSKVENPLVGALASLSYWSGFRPEELCWLTNDCVSVDANGDTRAEVKIVERDGKVLWEAKTPDSYGAVHIHPKALGALQALRNAAKDAFLLFPCTTSKDGLWNGDKFCKMYLAALRIRRPRPST